METRIKKIIADVLLIEVDQIDDNASPDTIEVWDSLNQMNIVVALEEEFDIQISDDNVIEMLNLKLINSIISEYLK